MDIKSQEKYLQKILMVKLRITDVEYYIKDQTIFLSNYYLNKLIDYSKIASEFEKKIISGIKLMEN